MNSPKVISLMVLLVAIVTLVILPAYAADVSQDAERHMARGTAAMKYAKSATDYQDAVAEFKKAIEYAPNWSDAWFNLGVAQEHAGDFTNSIKSFKTYLKKKPKAADRAKVESRIYELEYRQEKAAKEKQETVRQVEKTEKSWAEKLNGKWMEAEGDYWHDDAGIYLSINRYSIQVTGEQIKIIMTEIGLKGPVIHRVPVNKVVFNGSIEGNWLKGTFYKYGTSSTWSRDGVLKKKTVHYNGESSVDGPINLRPNGELHMPDPLRKWKRVQ